MLPTDQRVVWQGVRVPGPCASRAATQELSHDLGAYGGGDKAVLDLTVLQDA
jgi:hypothetical protein